MSQTYVQRASPSLALEVPDSGEDEGRVQTQSGSPQPARARDPVLIRSQRVSRPNQKGHPKGVQADGLPCCQVPEARGRAQSAAADPARHGREGIVTIAPCHPLTSTDEPL